MDQVLGYSALHMKRYHNADRASDVVSWDDHRGVAWIAEYYDFGSEVTNIHMRNISGDDTAPNHGPISKELFCALQECALQDLRITLCDAIEPIVRLAVPKILVDVFRTDPLFQGYSLTCTDPNRSQMMIHIIQDVLGFEGDQPHIDPSLYTTLMIVDDGLDEHALKPEIRAEADAWIIANFCDGEDRRGTRDKHHMSPDELHELAYDLLLHMQQMTENKVDETN